MMDIGTAIALLLGLVLAVMSWSLGRLSLAVPLEDRAFLDKPPLGFRFTWPLIRALEHYFGHWLPVTSMEMLENRLVSAGVEYSLSASQFQIGKIVAALMWGLLFAAGTLALGRVALVAGLCAAVVGYFLPEIWLRETTAKRKTRLLRELPFYLDIITLAVEAGTNLTGGITQAVRKSGAGPLRDEFRRVLRDVRAGKTRSDALRAMADRCNESSLGAILGSMIQAEKSGSSLGSVLRAQAEQLRITRFQKAEKLAMEAPVKLLLPLVLFIFPTTFLVLAFVIVGKLIETEFLTWAPLVYAYHWPGGG